MHRAVLKRVRNHRSETMVHESILVKRLDVNGGVLHNMKNSCEASPLRRAELRSYYRFYINSFHGNDVL